MDELLLFVVLVTVPAVALFAFDQQRRGRFRSLPPEAVDRPWFEARVLTVPPEVVGAAWDEDVGAEEVKALLARLMLEGKVSAALREHQLTLTLRIDRFAFTRSQERALVAALFVDGETIGRKALERHYGPKVRLDPKAQYDAGDLPLIFGQIFGLHSESFDPAEAIEDDLLEEARKLNEGAASAPLEEGSRPLLFGHIVREAEPGPSYKGVPDLMRWAYLVPLVLVMLGRGAELGTEVEATSVVSLKTALLLAAATLLHFAAMKTAEAVRRRPTIAAGHVCLLPLLLLFSAALARLFHASVPAVFFLGFLYAGSLVNVLLRARSTDDAAHIESREALRRGREFLERELLHGVPESWIPYAFAFGLGERLGAVGEPFRACGGAGAWNELAGALVKPVTGSVD